jgi:amino acid transporter
MVEFKHIQRLPLVCALALYALRGVVPPDGGDSSPRSIWSGFLLIIGIYVTYFVYDGFGDIYTKASVLENFHKKTPSEV